MRRPTHDVHARYDSVIVGQVGLNLAGVRQWLRGYLGGQGPWSSETATATMVAMVASDGRSGPAHTRLSLLGLVVAALCCFASPFPVEARDASRPAAVSMEAAYAAVPAMVAVDRLPPRPAGMSQLVGQETHGLSGLFAAVLLFLGVTPGRGRRAVLGFLPVRPTDRAPPVSS